MLEKRSIMNLWNLKILSYLEIKNSHFIIFSSFFQYYIIKKLKFLYCENFCWLFYYRLNVFSIWIFIDLYNMSFFYIHYIATPFVFNHVMIVTPQTFKEFFFTSYQWCLNVCHGVFKVGLNFKVDLTLECK